MAPSRSTIAAIRFGYGFRPGEAPPDGPDALMAQLRRGAAEAPGFAPESMEARAEALLDRRKGVKQASTDAQDMAKAAFRRFLERDRVERLAQSVGSPHGFHERLAFFWTDHFSVASRGPAQALAAPRLEVDAIRPHLNGRFADMLKAVTRHPAMLLYLNQADSIGPNSIAGRRREKGLNENLAREILELHTLGVDGPYGQDDVRQLAELLTGFSVDRDSGVFTFRPAIAEPGAETVLGRSYGGARASEKDALAALDDLAAHPATARHIARKLAAHFTADEPDADLVRHVEGAFSRSQGHLPAVYAALIDHPAAWDSFGAKVKQPFDFLVSACRAAGVEAAAIRENRDRIGRRSMAALRMMGQPLYNPPAPNGWPEEAAAWITPQGLAARMEIASAIGRKLAGRTDPRQFLDAALGDAAGSDTRFAVGAAAEKWEGIALALASPEFNRR